MKKLQVLPTALLSALLLLCLILTFNRCRDGRDLNLDVPRVSVVFAGQITDETDSPVAGALIQAGDVQGYSDQNGVFRLEATLVPQNAAVLQVSKDGYFSLSRAYSVQANTVRSVRVQLLARTYAGQIDVAQGGTVTVGQATLTFPANAFEGATFAYVFARYLDPADPDLPLHMPGDLRGVTAAGEESQLMTFGMIGVEIVSAGGQPLSVAPGKEVEISMPIAANQQATAPASIPLWWFDADRAVWVEEGAAQRSGDRYVGNVRHFTWWNCDIYGPRITLEGHVYLNDTDHPMSDVVVRVCAANLGCGYGNTSPDGYFGGGASQDQPLELTIRDNCGNVIYSANIGPFSQNTVLPDIIISGASAATPVFVEGRLVDCSLQGVSNGYLQITGTGFPTVAIPDAQGYFSFSSTSQCLIASQITFSGFDQTTLNSSVPQLLTWQPGIQSVGDIVVCTPADEFVVYTIDGQNHQALTVSQYLWNNRTFVAGSNGSGNVTLTFENNGQTGTFPLLDFTESTVTGLDSLGTPPMMTTTITQYGNVGDLILGTFDGQVSTLNGVTHAVSGSYRVRREE